MWREVESCCDLSSDIRGGFSRGAPPLPIPNRAVKPARADGTDTPVGRVGRRRTSGSPDVIRRRGSFLCVRGARLGRARRDAVRLTSGTPALPVRRLSKGVAVASLCCPVRFPNRLIIISWGSTL